MDIYQFMGAHPILTSFLALLLLEAIKGLPNMYLRHRNIKLHGWPPPHCDADGNFKEKEDDE